MKDDITRSSSGESPAGRKPPDDEAPHFAPGSDVGQSSLPSGFEQLSLGATVVGPGMRTEDHYEPGASLKIKGERGVFTYKHASVSRSGLVSLHLSGENGSRAVRPDQVLPVRKRAKW